MALQTPHTLLMIRPAAFGSNPETRTTNAFQQEPEAQEDRIQELAIREFDKMVALLHSHEIQTLVIPDSELPKKPDAIFPNNWLSTQPDGKLVIYPMLAPNRRIERRVEVLEQIMENFKVTETLDYSPYETKGVIVEGTGSMIFDHVNRIAFAARSPRTDEELVRTICTQLGYTPILFSAVDDREMPIYHTNVMMAVATKFALVCLDSIQDENEQESLLDSFQRTGHKVIAISFEQMKSFAGNALEVTSVNGDHVLIMSETAFHSLLSGQLDAITRFSEILPIAIPTIEKYSGGSVRCMLAGIHLEPKT